MRRFLDKGLLLKLAFVVLVLLGAVFCIELYFGVRNKSPNAVPYRTRIHDFFYYDRDGTFRIRPDARGWHRPYDGNMPILIRINSQGFRGPPPRENSSRKIAFVGDSITFDGGVKWKDTFVALVEKKLNGVNPQDEIDWECLNLGTTDAGIRQYYLKVRNHVLELKPDIIVIGFYLNDSRPPQGFIGESGRLPWEHWLTNSFLYRSFIVRKLHRMFRVWRITHNPDLRNRFKWGRLFGTKKYRESETSWQKLVEEARYDWGAAWQPESWKSVQYYVGKISELCKARDIRLLWLNFPASPQAEIKKPYDNLHYPQRMAQKIAEKYNIPYLDLLPALRKHKIKDVFNDQCHLKVFGNRVVSEAVFNWLRDVVLAPPPSPK